MTPRVVVLGDSVLDVWLSGTCQRVCREAPAPVVEIDDSFAAPGAAANTAANLSALGVHVEIVTMIGDDDAGATLLDRLAAHGVGTGHVVTRRGWQTPSKERIVAAEHVLLRCDRGKACGETPAVSARLAAEAAAAVQSADALVICDYSGMPTAVNVMTQLRRLRPALPLLVVDAHDLRPWRGLQPDVVTPNEAEAALLLGERVAPPPGPARGQFFADHRDQLLQRSGASSMTVTLDRDGVLLIDGDRPLYRTHTRPAHEEFCAGAGDTFTAAFTVARLAGMPAPQATDYAQLAADVVTAERHTSVCSAADIERRLMTTATSVPTHAQLAGAIAGQRSAGRRIVFTNGCFDVLHRGHVAYLNEARQAGDVLVVALNSDESVRRLKGPDRPINSAADRAAVLSALSCVDYVTTFDDDTPASLIESLRPDIYVKGGDYTEDMLTEAPVVRSYGGEVRILGYVADHSTTDTIARIRSVVSDATAGSR